MVVLAPNGSAASSLQWDAEDSSQSCAQSAYCLKRHTNASQVSTACRCPGKEHEECAAQIKTRETKSKDTGRHSADQEKGSEEQRHLVPAGAPSASSLAHSLSTVARRSVVATASALTAGSAELAWWRLLLCTSPSS